MKHHHHLIHIRDIFKQDIPYSSGMVIHNNYVNRNPCFYITPQKQKKNNKFENTAHSHNCDKSENNFSFSSKTVVRGD